jgi:hypothetical protein
MSFNVQGKNIKQGEMFKRGARERAQAPHPNYSFTMFQIYLRMRKRSKDSNC